ncbi:MAG: hypothetical protein J0L50_12440 [Sphingomonadales bacterium]|nr:hypothetical protein [Sphingomonadales bacterium]
MVSITHAPKPKNDRAQPRRPASLPAADLRGKVEFDMVLSGEGANRKLTFVLTALDNPELVGPQKGKGAYLRVPEGKTVEIELLLSEAWDWEYSDTDDDFTLAAAGHSGRYHVKRGSNDKRSRIVVIEPSGGAPETEITSVKHDEKFNLGVRLAQDNGGAPVGIEIDPIVKNPPPVGGLIGTQNQSSPLL